MRRRRSSAALAGCFLCGAAFAALHAPALHGCALPHVLPHALPGPPGPPPLLTTPLLLPPWARAASPCHSYVFGDGDPNDEFDKQRWQALGRYIQSRGGTVVAEELAPFLDLSRKQLAADRGRVTGAHACRGLAGQRGLAVRRLVRRHLACALVPATHGSPP